MDEIKFQLKDLQQLDPISYDEVDKILERYETLRVMLMRQLKRLNVEENPAAYDTLDSFLSDLNQSKEVRKRRAILAQMRKESEHE